MAILEVNHLGKSFGATEVLKDISFSLEQGESLAIIGSSGSGKTTLLRCLNYLEIPDSGSIRVAGQEVFSAASSASLSPETMRRNRLHFGLVFQSFNLFPQYTALENVSLAGELLARERADYKLNKKDILAAIRENGRELLSSVGLNYSTDVEVINISTGDAQVVLLNKNVLCEGAPETVFSCETFREAFPAATKGVE